MKTAVIKNPDASTIEQVKALSCPYCGSSEHIHIASQSMAICKSQKCNKEKRYKGRIKVKFSGRYFRLPQTLESVFMCANPSSPCPKCKQVGERVSSWWPNDSVIGCRNPECAEDNKLLKVDYPRFMYKTREAVEYPARWPLKTLSKVINDLEKIERKRQEEETERQRIEAIDREKREKREQAEAEQRKRVDAYLLQIAGEEAEAKRKRKEYLKSEQGKPEALKEKAHILYNKNPDYWDLFFKGKPNSERLFLTFEPYILTEENPFSEGEPSYQWPCHDVSCLGDLNDDQKEALRITYMAHCYGPSVITISDVTQAEKDLFLIDHVPPVSYKSKSDKNPYTGKMEIVSYNTVHNDPDRTKDKNRRLSSGRRTAQEIVQRLYTIALTSTSKTVKEFLESEFSYGDWLSARGMRLSQIYGRPDASSLHFGKLKDTTETLQYSGESSLITFAPAGAGKSQALAMPNLITYQGSVIALDVKGECYDNTATWRRENLGNKVLRFAPFDHSEAQFNPLDFVSKEAGQMWLDAKHLAELLVVVSSQKESFWEESARLLVQLFIAYLVFFEGKIKQPKNMRGLAAVMSSSYPEIQDILNKCILEGTEQMQWEATDKMEEMGSANQWNGIKSSCKQHLAAWRTEAVLNATEKTDWHPLDLHNGKTSVYLCVDPTNLVAHNAVFRVIIGIHINELLKKLPPKIPNPPILFLLDEFPQLQYMPPILRGIDTGRQYGLKFWLFLQSQHQLRKHYRDEAESIIEGCKVRAYMNADGITATNLSKELGLKASIMDSKAPLATAQELSGEGYLNYIILTATGAPPALVHKRYFADFMATHDLKQGETVVI